MTRSDPLETAAMLRLLIDEDVHGDIVDGLRRRQPTLDLVRVRSGSGYLFANVIRPSSAR